MNIVITDLTRFKNQVDKFCIAGIDINSRALIRPMPYLTRDFVLPKNIIPGSVFSGDFSCFHNPAPHVEDFYHKNLEYLGDIGETDFQGILENSNFSSISAGFGTIVAGEKKISETLPPERSIITITVQPNNISISCDNYGKLRVCLTDQSGVHYRNMALSDFGLFQFIDKAKSNLNKANDFIQNSKIVYARIGLGRVYENYFWLQVNGIYTFPGFLDGIRHYE